MKTASLVWISLTAFAFVGCGGAGTKAPRSIHLAYQARSLNLAVDGAGYFAVATPSGVAYAKSGTFGLNPEGRLIDAKTGASLLGWSASTSRITDSPEALKVPLGQREARATTNVSFKGNFSADAIDGNIYTAQVRTYDAKGDSHDLYFSFSPSVHAGSAPTWTWTAFEGDPWNYGRPIGSSSDPGNSKLTFDDRGVLISGSGTEQRVLLTFDDGRDGQPINAEFTGIAQLRSDSQIQSSGQDGFPFGGLEDYGIESDGAIMGLFNNGLTKSLGRIALAQFDRPQALRAVGDGLMRPTDQSGPARNGYPKAGGNGAIITP